MSTQFTNRQWRLPNNENKDKQSNYSMDFDSASSDYIEVSNMPILTDFSLSFWYKQNGPAGSYETVVGKDTIDGGILTSIAFTGGVLSFKNRPGSWTALTTTSASNTEFKHYSITYDSSANELKGYCNGILEVTTTPVFSGNEHSFNRIGRYFFGSYLDGELDGVAIFDYALTDGTGGTVNQIAALYGSSSTGIGNPMSLSPKPVAYYPLGDQDAFNGANYLVPNIAAEEADGDIATSYSPYALDFDSASVDYIDTNTTLDSSYSSLTISAWVKYDSLVSYKGTIFGQWVQNSFSNSTLLVYVEPSGVNKVFKFYWAPTASNSLTSTTTLQTNVWYHIVITWDGSNIKLFINGTEEDNKAVTSINNSTQTLKIGAFSKQSQTAYTGELNGKISNASIWDTALTDGTGGTPNQIAEIYNEGVPSNLNNHSAYSNLVSWWQLGSNSSFNSSLNQWTCIDEKGTNTGESSQTFNEDAIVDGVGSYANGLSSGMGGDEVIGDAPYSSSNALSVNMDVEDRVTDTPS